MSPNRTATAVRYEKALMDRARSVMSDNHRQAEVIAKHYTSLAVTALQLLDLVELRRHGQPDCDSVIDILVNEIKRAHRTDFGIEL